MGETGNSRFLGNLDPSAQEFWPRNPLIQNQMTLFAPAQIYYPYTHPYPYAEVQLMPFCDGGVGYSQFVASSAHARPATGKPPLSPLMSPLSATPTRMLLLSLVPTDVSEETVRRELEAFGEVRSVQMERVCDGIVAVSFYDLRHAQACLTEIREQHMQQQSRLKKHYDSLLTRQLASQVENLPTPLPPPARGLIAGRAVWAQFMIPVSTSCTPNDHNQGTLVIFNLDSEVSTSSLRDIFETFGSIKELRETPLKRHQRFVEFFDIRDAATALREMNGKKIQGKHVVIEFSRPGGHGRRFFNAIATTTLSTTSSTANPTVISPSGLAYHKITSRCPPALPHKPSEKSSPFNVPPRSYLSQTHPSTKRSDVGMNKRSSNAGTIEDSMASLCQTGSVVNGIEDSKRVPRWNPKKSPNGSSTAEKQQAQRNRPCKGRQKNIDSRFLINEDAITESHCKDSRTTIMIKNIPNKYSQKLLMNMLDNHCIRCNEQVPDGGDQPLSSYDFVYLPIDFNNKCNVGYGFVNMTSPQATWRLYKAFHLQSWEGLEPLKEHFKNSKFLCDTKAYLPVVFSPPRDGKQLTEPQPIVGDNKLIISTIANDTKASQDNDDGDEGEMVMDSPHRLNNGDHICDCDEDVEDYDRHDQSRNDDYRGDDDEDDSTTVIA